MLNRRKFPRLDEQWKLNYRILDAQKFAREPIRQYSVNISGGGICFLAEEEVPVDTMLALDLQSDNLPAPMVALARVVRCKQVQDKYEIGCEYWWIGWQNDDAQRSMADYIAKIAKGEK